MTSFHRFLPFIIFFSFSSATTIYVATNGSNETGDGTEQNPFASIWTGIWATESGDTVYIAPGEYYSEVSIPWMCIYRYDGWTGEEYESNNITIMGEDMNTTFIRDQSVGETIEFGNFLNQGMNCQTIDSSRITIESLTIEGNFSFHNIQHVKIKNVRSIGSFTVQNYPAELSSYYVEITNSIFENNFFLMDAGGSDDGMTFDINYSTFYNIEISGGSMEGLFNFRNSIFYNHILDITETVDLEFNYCFINEDVSGIGNINGDDPLFCNVALGDFSYSESSICVGAGEDSTNIGAIGVGCGPSFGPNIEYVEDQEIEEDTDPFLFVTGTFYGSIDDYTLYAYSDTADFYVIDEPAVFGNGWRFELIPSQNWFGEATVTLILAENESGLADTTSFQVTVLPINDSPEPFSLIYPTITDTISVHTDTDEIIQFNWEESVDVDSEVNYITTVTLDYFGDIYSDTYESNEPVVEVTPYEWAELMTNLELERWTLEYTVQASDEEYTVETEGEFVLQNNTLSVENDITPISFRLHQNYPNPFNPVTTLRYYLPENGLVNITIYDMLGNIINQLVNEAQNSGYKSIQWDATNYQGQPVSAGVYIYRIEAGDFRQTKKMILLK